MDKLPSEEWFYQQIIDMRYDFVLPASDHNVRGLAKTLRKKIRHYLLHNHKEK